MAKQFCSPPLTGGGYSTTEVKTGETWINGKPIYRMVKMWSNSMSDWSFNPPNLSEVVSLRGIAKREDITSYLPIPYTHPTDQTQTITIFFHSASGGVGLRLGSTYDDKVVSMAIIMEYTKTTD